MTKQQLLATIRQMQQFLKGQETRFVEGLRIMKHRLTTLQNTVTKSIPDPQTGKNNRASSEDGAGTLFRLSSLTKMKL